MMTVSPSIKIYHVEGPRSERVAWLCEELALPYELIFKRGDMAGSMDMIRAVNPLVPMAPTVAIGGQIMVESGAILEAIARRYGNGQLVPAAESDDFIPHLQWLHFAEGTAMARMHVYANVAAALGAAGLPRPAEAQTPFGPAAVLTYVDRHLASAPYFGGSAFSLADIMMHFPIKWSGTMAGIDSDSYAAIADWRRRIEARGAFARMTAATLPDGRIPFPV